MRANAMFATICESNHLDLDNLYHGMTFRYQIVLELCIYNGQTPVLGFRILRWFGKLLEKATGYIFSLLTSKWSSR